jgi:PhzF family phenazine biosynthesis protein
VPVHATIAAATALIRTGVHAELTTALGLPPGSIPAAAEIRPVSVSRAKLIVPLRDPDTVHQCRPDLPALWDLCRRHDATGAYVFAPHPDSDPVHVVARQFPVDAGFPEDPATGVAAAALAAYLARDQRPGQAIRDGYDELDLAALTAASDELPEPELR